MIIAIGDVHGEFKEMQSKMVEIMESAGEPVNFVQVGDFGLGFERPKKELEILTTINDVLKQNLSRLWIIRGNHDNPAFWQPGCGFELSNIQFVKDDSLIEIDGRTCYFVGGAVSVDRKNRTQGIDYWSAEVYKPKGFDQFGRNMMGIDILFTHDVYHEVSAFSTASETVKFWCNRDPYLMSDIIRSQYEMMSLYHHVYDTNPNFSWYHGHYHESHLTINGEQKTHSLGILEFKEVR